MATKRSCRWPHILHLASMLPYNIGDWRNCANTHPLQIFAFLLTSSQSRQRIPRFLLSGCIHDHIPHPEHHEQFKHGYETIEFLFHISQNTIKINYNYFSVILKMTFQFYLVWKQVYFFLLIKSNWLAEIAVVLLAYQDRILLWIPFFSILAFWYKFKGFLKREERTQASILYCLLLQLQLPTFYKIASCKWWFHM